MDYKQTRFLRNFVAITLVIYKGYCVSKWKGVCRSPEIKSFLPLYFSKVGDMVIYKAFEPHASNLKILNGLYNFFVSIFLLFSFEIE